jgi:receptor expression-enhancing protein 5/6
MDKIKSTAMKYNADFDKYLEKFPYLGEAEKATNVPKTAMAAGLVSVSTFCFCFFLGMPFICNAIGFFYPTYMSFKAIESAQTNDDKHWLTYWVVFAFLNVVEEFSGFILSWFSYYYFCKLAFLIFLFFPKYNGAEFIYNNAIRPLLLKYESLIDAKANMVGEKISQSTKFAQSQAERISEFAEPLIDAAATQPAGADTINSDLKEKDL